LPDTQVELHTVLPIQIRLGGLAGLSLLQMGLQSDHSCAETAKSIVPVVIGHHRIGPTLTLDGYRGTSCLLAGPVEHIPLDYR
jgi:hypothetical protein